MCLPSHKIYENEDNSPVITYKKYKPILFFNTLNQIKVLKIIERTISQEEEDEATHTLSAQHHHK